MAVRSVLLVTLFVLKALAGQTYFEPSADGHSAVVRTAGTAMRIDSSGVSFAPGLRMNIVGASQAGPTFEDPTGGVSSYYKGNSERRGVLHFHRVRFRRVLPGIDVVYYSRDGRLEYDFVVAPGADPGAIALRFDSTEQIAVRGGKLTAGALVQSAPVSYQGEKSILSRWVVKGSTARLEVDRYDTERPLVIDPVVESAGWFGGMGRDVAWGVAVDAAGNTWVAGETNSTDLGTPGSFQGSRAAVADTDAYLAKLSPSGNVLAVTYFGGSKQEIGRAVALDAMGNPVLSGVTWSANLRVTDGAAQPAISGAEFDVFVAKFNQTATHLEWATYLGGSGADWLGNIAIAPTGEVWAAGWTTSNDFPVRSAIQGGNAGGGGDAFVTRIASNGASFTWSTYYGSAGIDQATGIAVGANGSVHVVGSTTSDRLTLAHPMRATRAGAEDAFYMQIEPSSSTLTAATYLGGSAADSAVDVALDGVGRACVVGYTASRDFPVTSGAVQRTHGGSTDAFVTRMSGDGRSATYSTYFGGRNDDWAEAIAADASGSVYIVGSTNSPDLPVQNAVQRTYASGDKAGKNYDAFAARLAPTGSALIYSTYYGGRGEDHATAVAIDRAGRTVLAGATSSPDLPSASGSFSMGRLGEEDAFLVKLSSDTVPAILSVNPAQISLSAAAGAPAPLPFTIQVRASAGTLPFSMSSDASWVRPQATQSTAPADVAFTVDASRLPAGQHTANVLFQWGVETVIVPVRVTITPMPVVSGIDPSVVAAGSPQTTLVLSGNGFSSDSIVEAQGRTLRPTVLNTTTMTVAVPADMIRSEGRIEIAVVTAGVRSAPAVLSIAAARPVIASGGIVHAATWLTGAVAPGEFVIIGGTGFGTDSFTQNQPDGQRRYPSSLSGVRVWFDEFAAPVLWVRSGQIAIQVPHGVRDRNAVRVSVEQQGLRSSAVSVAVQHAVPGLFTANSDGAGQVAAVNEDGSFNSPLAPAQRGTVIVMYATGNGLNVPSLAEGTLESVEAPSRSSLPVEVSIGGRGAEVLYAGAVPGAITGLLQLNVRIPDDVPADDALPVQMYVGTAASPVVTLAVR